MQTASKIFFFIIAVSVLGCGVKGRPTAPTYPSPIGRGEPVFKDAKKPNQKTTIPSLEQKSGE